MRIVIVGVRADTMVSFRGDLIREMLARGHTVLAITPEQAVNAGDDPASPAEIVAMGARYLAWPVRRTGLNPWRDVVAFAWLLRTLRTFRADAILVAAAKPVVYGSIAARIAGVPMRAAMITGIGSALGGGIGLRRRAVSALLRLLYGIALRQAQVVFFQNPDDEAHFRRLGLIGPQIRVARIAGSGVNLERYAPVPLPPPPATFLMIGRLIRDKGVVEYVEAARQVRRLHPEARFHLIGALDTNPTAISSAQLEAWRREGVIDYLGTTSDVRPFLAAAHVYVLPSYGEGMPRSVLEAMAAGRAIVTTDVPGCRETVEPGRNGVLVPARDAGALARAMSELLTAPDRLAGLGRESRLIAEARFDVHEVNRRIIEAMRID